MSNIISIISLFVIVCLFFRGKKVTQTNLIYLAALCLPFAEALTVKIGMRFILTDWLGLLIAASLVSRSTSITEHDEWFKAIGVFLALCLVGWSVVSLCLVDESRVSDASRIFGESIQIREGGLRTPFSTAVVETVRWIQELILLSVVTVLINTWEKWETVMDWLLTGALLNSVYGLYQVARFFLGITWLPLLPYTYGRHFSPEGYNRATGFMWEPTVFGSFTALICLVAFWRVRSEPSIRNISTFSIILFSLLLSFSGSGYIVFAVGLSVYLVGSIFLSENKIGDIALGTGIASILSTLITHIGNVGEVAIGIIKHKIFGFGYSSGSREVRLLVLEKYINRVVPEFGGIGLGLGQVKFLTGGTYMLPLKVLVELGVLGFMLFNSLMVTVILKVFSAKRYLNCGDWVFALSLLSGLGAVVFMQGKSKINFVFFFAGLLLSIPKKYNEKR